MIVDMVRNDLGRIASTGSVHVPHLFEVERYPTVWQMTSTVEAASPAGLTELFAALFPCASITGAPKVSTMRIIAGLETAPRRVYTGAIGFVAPDGRAQFNVAIRTVLIDRRRGQAEYGVGGGIVWDSTAGDEYEECRIKARLLTQPRPRSPCSKACLWTPAGGLALIDGHLRRLGEACEYFGYPHDAPAVRRLLDDAVRTLPAEPHKLRLLLHRDGRLECSATPLSAAPSPDPVRLRLALAPVSAANPFLYHKTTHRQVYTDARRGLPPDCEALLWNERGELTESETANLVLSLDGRLLTPPVACGLLPGVLRADLLARGEIAEAILTPADLARADEIFLINSVRFWRRTVMD